MNKLLADWPAPDHIGSITTTRIGGASKPPFDSNNMGINTGDVKSHVEANHDALKKELNLPSEPIWLHQTHSNECVVVENDSNRHADAAVTRIKSNVLAIQTADCMPILVCNREGTEIAAIHAGWRGLANGIIESTLKKMKHQPSELIAWVGPSICASCFEVGEDVLQAFARAYPNMRDCFTPANSKWLADLPKLAQMIFAENGLISVYQSHECTKEQSNKYYSYRRDGETGRMATLIWFKQDSNNAK